MGHQIPKILRKQSVKDILDVEYEGTNTNRKYRLLETMKKTRRKYEKNTFSMPRQYMSKSNG